MCNRERRFFLAALVLPAHAQDAPPAGQSDLATAYGQAMAEFQAGNFVKAATESRSAGRSGRGHSAGRADFLHNWLCLF